MVAKFSKELWESDKIMASKIEPPTPEQSATVHRLISKYGGDDVSMLTQMLGL